MECACTPGGVIALSTQPPVCLSDLKGSALWHSVLKCSEQVLVLAAPLAAQLLGNGWSAWAPAAAWEV